MESSTATRPRPALGRLRSDPRAGVSGPQRMRRIALIAAVVALIPVFISFASSVSGPSNSTFGIRAVEWLRGHGAAGIVSKVESAYYSLTAPSKGGPTLRALPKVGAGGAAVVAAAYRPPSVAPLIHPALPGEGVWHAARRSLEANPPILVTTLRNQTEYPRVIAGLAWIDGKRTTLKLVPGRQEPAVEELPRGSMQIPTAGRANLLATFNSAFKLSDSGGGFALNGRTYATMHDGQGALVGYTDGHSDVIEWNYGSRAPSYVAFARQNLPLIVNHGRTNPNLNNGIEWGATLGNAILVWRSGIGVDSHGNLIYAAGDNQTVGSLAATLVHAGAVRAMELDINSYWVSFIDYGQPGAHSPSNLLPDMTRSAYRYLEPDDRDFFAIYSR